MKPQNRKQRYRIRQVKLFGYADSVRRYEGGDEGAVQKEIKTR
jgi:hypothetical protein